MRILIVDDSSATRTFLRESLEVADGDSADRGSADRGSAARGSAEIEVSEADSGLEALRLLPRGPYDLVVTDINMSGVNGLELLKFIKDQPQYASTRVLLISTQSSPKDQQRGLDLGADAFLAKPFSSEQLRMLVSKLTGAPSG